MSIYRGAGGSIPSEVESTIIPVSQGGTGATTIAEARTNLNAAKSGINSDITQLIGLEVALAISEGGTGATNASNARNNLDAAQKGANSDITSITGLTTALAIDQGGTAATTAAGARASLSAAVLGDNDDITSLSGITGGISTVDYIDIDTAATPTDAVGRLKWSSTEAGPEVGMGGGNVTLQLGQEELVYVLNKTGSAFTDMHVVRVIGAQGNRLEVALAQANNDTNSASSLAVVTEPIADNQQGFATRSGLVHNVDTSAFAEGAMLFLSPTTPGDITSTAPTAPDHAVRIGWCVRSHATVGSIYVHIQNGYELDELHNVLITSPTNNQVLAYDSAAGVWKNTSSGSGSGDVVGPTSATDGAVALFDGTTGKLLKNGVVLGSAATTSSGDYATAAQGTKADSAAQPTSANTFTANQIVSVTDNTNAALRITQLGTGNALLVEDSTNPDSTPFVIDAAGNVIKGATATFTSASSLTAGIQAQSTGVSASSLGLYSFNTTAASAGRIDMGRTRGALGAYDIVQSGDQLGVLRFTGGDGTQMVSAAEIRTDVDGTPGTNDMPGRLVFSTTADGASTPTERMRIDSAGKVGIGSTSFTNYGLRVGSAITGGTSAFGIGVSGAVQSDVTAYAYYVRVDTSTQAAAFTAANITGFEARQGTFGAGSTVTNQYGFVVTSSLTGATNNYGFHSNIASGTGRYNFYANGTADNYFAGKVRLGTAAAPTVSLEVAATDAILIPKGTTAQQPTGVAGYFRFNTSTTQFEGHNGTSWSSVGGAAISNDTSTASYEYPLFASATSGTALTVYTSNSKYLYKPSTGELQASLLNATNGIVMNSQTISASMTIPTGSSGTSAGPITVASGQSVTVSSGSRWVIV